MTAPIPSKLDNRQMLQGAYDEATGSFRTTAEATIVNADIDVSLDSTEDNVAIRSSTGIELSINAAGAANIVSTDLGVRADTAATTDTGTFSLISLIKRGLQNWTTLLSRIPTLVGGKIPVDASNSTGLTGTFTANAGTNLNTSALNLEATQLLIKAKTDNIDTPLSNISKGKLLRNVDFDNIAATYNTTQDIYTYKLLTVTQATVTITYTDTSKSLISTVVRT